MHRHPVKEIKNKYQNENNLFNTIKTALIDQYEFSEDNTCVGYDFLEEEYAKIVKLTKQFNNTQTIGEAKKIIDNAHEYAKKQTKLLTNGQAYKILRFTKNGAIGGIELKYEIL